MFFRKLYNQLNRMERRQILILEIVTGLLTDLDDQAKINALSEHVKTKAAELKAAVDSNSSPAN